MKRIFQKDGINPSLPGIIVMSHGPLACALVESAQMLLGDVDNLAAFSFEASDSPEEYFAACLDAIRVFPANSLLAVDLLGGTPCNKVLEWALTNAIPASVVSGINLPMLCEAVTMRDEIGGTELADAVIESVKRSNVNVSRKMGIV